MGGPQTSDDKKLLGVLIMLAGQAVQAMQNVVEEKLLHGSECDETFIVAVEGFWGLLLCTGIFMPLAKFLPGDDGKGVHEDVFPEDFYMCTHSGKVLGLVILFVLVVMVSNVTGLIITNLTQSTTRNVVDGVRTMCVWMTSVVLFYVQPAYGERIGMYSLVEAAGFLLLIIGVFVYSRFFRLPCAMLYPLEMDDSTSCSPSIPLAPDTEQARNVNLSTSEAANATIITHVDLLKDGTR